MVKLDFLARLGVFVRRQFLDAETCRQIRTELRRSPARPATVVENPVTQGVDEYTRRTKKVAVPASLAESIQSRLLAIQAEIASHFALELAGCQPSSSCTTSRGISFACTRDRCAGQQPDFVQQRRVSVVVFLSGEIAEPAEDSCSGGALTFYGLLPGPAWERIGFPLRGEEGLLVAFRSEILHEVTAVRQGDRYTIVTWFV